MALQRNDILWKGVIEDFFEALLRFFFKDADRLVDFTKGFVFLDKELAALSRGPELEHPKVVDKLVRVFTRSGDVKFFLVHLEVQGYADGDFARRMFTYYSRIWDKHKQPLTCIAIFLGRRGRQDISFFEQEWLGSKVRFEYNCYYIGDQDEECLRKMDNPFAVVVLIALLKLRHRSNIPQLLDSKLALAEELLRRGLPKDKTRQLLLDFLSYYLHFEEVELNTTFERQLQLLTNQTSAKMGITEQILDIAKQRGKEMGLREGIQEGLQKGIQQGIQKGRQQGVKEGKQQNALSVARQLKILGVSTEIIRKSTGLSVSRIKAL